MLAHKLVTREIGMPHQRAAYELVVLDTDAAEFADAIDVDQVTGLRDPHVHHRRKALPAGDDLGVLATRRERGEHAGSVSGAS